MNNVNANNTVISDDLKIILVEEKVQLLVGDESKYQEVAYLVDRPDFLKIIRELRDRLEIKAPLTDVYSNFSNLFAEGWKKEYQKWIENNPARNEQLISKIKRLLTKLNKPLYLLDIILQVIFFKSVIDYSGLVKILNKNSSFDDTTIGIFPTLYTTKQEIDEAWKRVQELFKTLPGSFCFTDERKNNKPEFRRDREWYWRNLSGESYTDIALSLESKEFQANFKKRKKEKIEKTSRDGIPSFKEVRQALGRYKSALKK